MADVAAGIAYGIEKLVEGTALAVKGIYDPTLPLRATLVPITSTRVPKAYHTISVIKGRAYLFGGKTSGEEGREELADNDMHIVILPSSGVENSDYKRIDATSDAPPKRFGHCAAVIEDRIYVFGGCAEDRTPLDESGRVWVFDTISNKWTNLDTPAEGRRPEPRTSCAAVASEHPRPVPKRTDDGSLPQQPPDPESVLPEPPAADSYGTLILQGGQGKGEAHFNDLWSFDISTRTWAELPPPPPPTTITPTLSFVDHRLYTFSSGQTSFLDLDPSSFDDRSGKGELGLAPLRSWASLPPTSSDPEKRYPGERAGASMIPVTTGQGRSYLLLFGGQSRSGETLDDIWALQLKPEAMTAASLKDAARQAIKKDTNEAQWDEVKYLNAEGAIIQEGQAGRGFGTRRGFAAARGTEVDGASVVLWGGAGEDGKPRGDGLLITVDR